MVRHARREERAQGLIEFALILPFLCLLIFGVIDFGSGLKAYITTSSAAREAARYASIGNLGPTSGAYVECDSATTNAVVLKACGTMGNLKQAYASVNVACNPTCVSGASATVTTQYQYHYITPLRSIIGLFSGGSLPGYLTVTSSTTMRIE